MKSLSVPSSPCWNCGAVHDMAAGVGHRKKPRPGMISICIECGQPMIFDGELKLRTPSIAEWLEIGADKRLQRALKTAQQWLIRDP